MNKLLDGLEKFLLPIAEKLNNQRHLGALRDGFIAVMPLMIIGAFAVMINNVFFNLDEGSLFQTVFGFDAIPDSELPSAIQFIKTMDVAIANASLSIIALAVSFSIAFSFTEARGLKGLEAGIISVAAFFTSFAVVDGAYSTGFFGAANIITAIIIALVSGEIYNLLIKKNIRIKMPEGVPPAVERSFSALVPAMIIVVLFALINTIIINVELTQSVIAGADMEITVNSDMIQDAAGENVIEVAKGESYDIYITSFSQFIQAFVAAPLKLIAGGAAGIYVYAFFSNVFWFFGIHGPNTLAFLDQTVFTPAAVANGDLIAEGLINNWGVIEGQEAALAASEIQPSMYTKTIVDSFAFIGGSGATIGLVIALFIGSKVDAHRKMAKYSIGPAFFNINEPLLFGLPIVFNPVLFIPFVVIQPLLLTVAIIAMNLNLVPMYGILIPWTSPVGLGAFLGYGGSIPAAILAILCAVISTLVYLPFVIIMNRTEAEKGAEA